MMIMIVKVLWYYGTGIMVLPYNNSDNIDNKIIIEIIDNQINVFLFTLELTTVILNA